MSNGDDLFALTEAGANSESYVVIDKIGDFGPDPGSGWDVAGVEDATLNHTLVRKASILSGNTDWESSSGTNEDNSEWIVYPQNSWQFLGSRNDEIFGNYIHVSSEGTDDMECGAIENPCNTIQYTIDNIKGYWDTIIIDNGTYNENLTYTTESGTLLPSLKLASNFYFTGDSSDIYSTVIMGQDNGYIINCQNIVSVSIGGITLEGGFSSYQSGDGLYIENANNITLSNFPIKVFNLIEKINIILLKKNFITQSKININDYQLDVNSRALKIGKKKLKLTQKETEIIFFIKNSNKEVSISSLKKNVWGHSSELETHTVETHVYRLRKKIKDFFNDNKFIKSTDNGYKI